MKACDIKYYITISALTLMVSSENLCCMCKVAHVTILLNEEKTEVVSQGRKIINLTAGLKKLLLLIDEACDLQRRVRKAAC